jgi:hypothetical protein
MVTLRRITTTAPDLSLRGLNTLRADLSAADHCMSWVADAPDAQVTARAAPTLGRRCHPRTIVSHVGVRLPESAIEARPRRVQTLQAVRLRRIWRQF